MSKQSRLVIVLAGGESKRIGKYKAAQPEENPLVTILMNNILSDTYDIILVVKNIEQKNILTRLVSPKPILIDLSKQYHVLVGMLTGVIYAIDREYNYVLIIGVDQPFMNRKYIHFMFRLAEKVRKGAIIPKWKQGYLEPLGAVYRTEHLYEAIMQCISTRSLNKCSIRAVIKTLESICEVSYISAEQICSLFGHVFYNVNTLQDLEIVKMSVRCKT